MTRARKLLEATGLPCLHGSAAERGSKGCRLEVCGYSLSRKLARTAFAVLVFSCLPRGRDERADAAPFEVRIAGVGRRPGRGACGGRSGAEGHGLISQQLHTQPAACRRGGRGYSRGQVGIATHALPKVVPFCTYVRRIPALLRLGSNWGPAYALDANGDQTWIGCVWARDVWALRVHRQGDASRAGVGPAVLGSLDACSGDWPAICLGGDRAELRASGKQRAMPEHRMAVVERRTCRPMECVYWQCGSTRGFAKPNLILSS